jgi:hypothetical protein
MSRNAVGNRIAYSSIACANRCRSRWGAAIKTAPRAAIMASSAPFDAVAPADADAELDSLQVWIPAQVLGKAEEHESCSM